MPNNELIEFTGNCPRNVAKDAKYSVRSGKGRKFAITIVYRTDEGEMWYPATDEHPILVEMVNKVKQAKNSAPGGVFYINEYKQVIVPVSNSDNYYYAGEYPTPLIFSFEGRTINGDGKDLDNNPLSPGDIWEGPHCGIRYVLTAQGTDLYYDRIIKGGAIKQRVKLSKLIGQELASKTARKISRIKGGGGGRIYINEFCQIFAPVDGEYVYIGKLDSLDEWFPKPVI